jgi:hypothetical protein
VKNLADSEVACFTWKHWRCARTGLDRVTLHALRLRPKASPVPKDHNRPRQVRATRDFRLKAVQRTEGRPFP